MRFPLLSSAAALVLSLPLAASAEPVSWEGAYVGISGGYSWTKSKFTDSQYNGGIVGFPAYSFSVDDGASHFAIFGGYNWQRNNRVLGVEIEVGRSNAEGFSLPPFNDPYDVPYDAGGGFEAGMYGSISGRVGLVRDETLYFGKLGLAYSSASAIFSDSCTEAPCGDGLLSASGDIGLGVVLGVGVDHKLNEYWAIRAEYSFTNFGKAEPKGVGLAGVVEGQDFTIGNKITNQRLSIGLSYQF